MVDLIPYTPYVIEVAFFGLLFWMDKNPERMRRMYREHRAKYAPYWQREAILAGRL